MAKAYTDTLPTQLGAFLAFCGGVRAAERLLGENAGTLLHIANRTRQPTRAFRDRFNGLGWRTPGFRAGALAMCEWAEQPPPRAPWPASKRKEFTK